MPGPFVSRNKSTDAHNKCMAQYSGYTKTSITKVMPTSGKVASRVAKPMAINAEHESSNVALITAATAGGSSGTMYSSRNSAMVVSQLAIFVNPELQNTAAMATRNVSWRIEGGKQSRRAIAW